MTARPCIPTAEFLRDVPLFADLAHEGLARLSDGASEVRAPRGSSIFRRGEPCTGIYVVVDGQVKLVLQSSQGMEKVIAIQSPRDCLGLSPLFLQRPHRATAQAIADTTLVHVARAAVITELQRHTRFAQRVIEDLSRRVYHYVNDLESVTLHSGTDRVIDYLVENVHVCPSAGAGVKLAATKGIIASRLSLTQEHFSRILHELAAAGLIGVEGRDIRIPDLERLRARCG